MRPVQDDVRFDFRGGVNKRFTHETIDSTEVINSRNMRQDELGGWRKRGGSQRIHTEQLESGADVVGLFQWRNPAGNLESVVICGGHFFHKIATDATFTKVAQAPLLDLVIKCRFQVHREGAAITLYIAQGDSVYSWDGTTFDQEPSANAPNAYDIEIYKSRLMAIDLTKTLYGTAVNAPENWTGGETGFAQDVETYDTEGCEGLLTIGSSLLIFKADNVARFTGVDRAIIRIDRETEGVSSDTGLKALHTLMKVDEFAMFLSDGGILVATESGIESISTKVDLLIRKNLNWAAIQNSVGVYLKQRGEVLFMHPFGASTQNDEGIVFNNDTHAWYATWDFQGFDVCVAARYERADGTETAIVGGYDGRIRELDPVGLTGKDDRLRDDTGGTAIPGDVELPFLEFGVPGQHKSLRNPIQTVITDLDATGVLKVDWENEKGDTGTLTIGSKGAGVKAYLWGSKAKGGRLKIKYREETAADWVLQGSVLRAAVGRRVA